MNKRWAFLFLLIFGLITYQFIRTSKSSQEVPIPNQTDHVKNKQASYFLPISISKFTTTDLPCLDIRIDDVSELALLDLGFRGQFSFSPKTLAQIKNKKLIGNTKMYGIRGGEYEERLFEIPLIEIGRMSFDKPIIHEYPDDFHAESTILKKGNPISPAEPIKIGWELFGNTNLFLDLGNSKAAFCDSLKTLQEKGCFSQTFTKVPMLLERGIVEFTTQTPKGGLRCMLDTGATWNIINHEIENGQSIDEIAFEPENIIHYSSFQIGEDDFGPIDFHPLPIKIPIHIEAMLGMEFFRKHLVFLDFSENYIYFSKDCSLQPVASAP